MTLSRQCSRAACARPAAGTLTYVYSDSTVVLGPLATYAEPHAYDLCDDHADRLTAPRGWDVVRLPIDYTEVTISRTMFRNGGSEYAINGTSCRLLDIQELLSDSGIGREMHVIVGQGQLDAVLRATPEERRGFIEEAAGVLKHRRRKEKALRKLDAMEGDLARVRDLTAEIRRQLGPLGRQAATARRAAVIHITVRDARARLLADDLTTARTTLEQELADESALAQRRVDRAAGRQRHLDGVVLPRVADARGALEGDLGERPVALAQARRGARL